MNSIRVNAQWDIRDIQVEEGCLHNKGEKSSLCGEENDFCFVWNRMVGYSLGRWFLNPSRRWQLRVRCPVQQSVREYFCCCHRTFSGVHFSLLWVWKLISIWSMMLLGGSLTILLLAMPSRSIRRKHTSSAAESLFPGCLGYQMCSPHPPVMPLTIIIYTI